MGATHEENKISIFNIQRFSIHDGPGIRTTVFVKGCPLDCKWCGNPESKNPVPRLILRDIECKGCGACIDACPQNAINMSSETGRVIDWAKCDQCLQCVDACIYGSLNITGKYMTVDQIMDEVMSDSVFYETSNGGITVSGGEPLSQSAFVRKLMIAAKQKGLHTALDTSGYAPWSDFEQVIEYVDLVLFDVKHMDTKKHKEGTAIGNEIILQNLANTSRLTEVWIRIPLIAGYNDSEENIDSVGRKAAELGIKRISLLPYHEGGKSKCEQLGHEYMVPEARSPSDDRIKELALILKSYGLDVVEGI